MLVCSGQESASASILGDSFLPRRDQFSSRRGPVVALRAMADSQNVMRNYLACQSFNIGKLWKSNIWSLGSGFDVGFGKDWTFYKGSLALQWISAWARVMLQFPVAVCICNYIRHHLLAYFIQLDQAPSIHKQQWIWSLNVCKKFCAMVSFFSFPHWIYLERFPPVVSYLLEMVGSTTDHWILTPEILWMAFPSRTGGICPRYSILMIHTLVSTPKQLMFMDVPPSEMVTMSHFHRFSSSSKKSWIIQSDI
jgi:hypothetical protein